MNVFLIHQILEKVRSVFRTRQILLNIFSGLLIFLIVTYMVLISLFIDIILEAIYPEQDILQKATELLFYYLLIDIILRFLFQKMSLVSVDYYRHLPIKRNKIILYSLWKSLFSLLNLIPLLLLMSFFVKVAWPAEGAQFATSWFITFICLLGINHFLNINLRMFFTKRPLLIFLFFIVVMALTYIEFSGVYELSASFGQLIYFILSHPYWLVIPLSIFGLGIWLAYRVLDNRMYEEAKDEEYGSSWVKRDFSNGNIMDYMLLELLLIFRNKRPKRMMLMGGFFILYGLLFFSRSNISDITLVFYCCMLSGMLISQYGQLLFSWESSYFDFIISQKISVKRYIDAKFWLHILFTIVNLIILTPYGFFGLRVLYFLIACSVFHTGISIYLIILIGTFNTKRIDLDKGIFMNYQGVSVHQFILVLSFGIPVLIAWIIDLLEIKEYGPALIGLLGITGLFFRKYACSALAKRFMARKYIMSESFRR